MPTIGFDRISMTLAVEISCPGIARRQITDFIGKKRIKAGEDIGLEVTVR